MSRKKILLVDDANTILMMERMILQKEPYDLVTANDGEEALVKVEPRRQFRQPVKAQAGSQEGDEQNSTRFPRLPNSESFPHGSTTLTMPNSNRSPRGAPLSGSRTDRRSRVSRRYMPTSRVCGPGRASGDTTRA